MYLANNISAACGSSLAHCAVRRMTELKRCDRSVFFVTQSRVDVNAAYEKTGAIASNGAAMILSFPRASASAGSAIIAASTRPDSTAACIGENGISTNPTDFESAPFLSSHNCAYLALFNAHGIKPDNGNSLAWDPAELVVAALRKIGPSATAEQLRAYLDGVTHYVGINGAYDFRAYPQRGLAEQRVMMVRWDDAKQTWVGVSKPGGGPL